MGTVLDNSSEEESYISIRMPSQIMRNKMFLFICVFVFHVLTSYAQAACPTGFQAHEQSCYSLVRHHETWGAAQAYCRAVGAYLAEVSNQQENDFIKAMVTATADKEPLWLGGTDLFSEGNWVWARNLEVFDYDDWNTGEPNNAGHSADLSDPDEGCLEMLNGNAGHRWNDQACDVKKYFVCERDNGSNLVG